MEPNTIEYSYSQIGRLESLIDRTCSRLGLPSTRHLKQVKGAIQIVWITDVGGYWIAELPTYEEEADVVMQLVNIIASLNGHIQSLIAENAQAELIKNIDLEENKHESD